MKHRVNQNYENSKHQKPNFKQIPMTQIQNSKQMICFQLFPKISFPAGQGLRGDAIQLW